MQQHEFIFMAKNLKVTNVTQDDSGNTIVNLRPKISIVHNYKKNNSMKISFAETNDTFVIPSKNDLEEIYRLHLTNENLEHILIEYCKTHLKKT